MFTNIHASYIIWTINRQHPSKCPEVSLKKISSCTASLYIKVYIYLIEICWYQKYSPEKLRLQKKKKKRKKNKKQSNKENKN
jgi:hypothetical protein